MSKLIRKFSLFFVLFATTLACVSPAVAPINQNPAAPLDQNAISTVIAGTSVAAATQTARQQVSLAGKSPTPTATLIPSMTPFASFTPVVLGKFIPLVSVTRNTNCRAGPGEIYDKVGALRVGEVAEVLGRSKDAQWWIIRNPNRQNSTCWLSAKYASVIGVAGAVPILTPPPTPKPTRTPTRQPTATSVPPTAVPPSSIPPTSAPPGFTASYSNMENCPGMGWWAEIRLQNTGGANFESIFLGVRDTVTDTVYTFELDDFINMDCSASNTQTNLPVGGTGIVSAPIFPYDFTGNEFQASITLCTEPGQNGTCLSQVFTFTP